MRLLLLSPFVALMAVSPLPALAEGNPVVVELYTSQGCSSRPPADEMLRALQGREDVLPLALHVDYWDYIGWKDTFGQRAFADRQRAYAQVAGATTIYTPQMIIGGMDHVVGARQGALDNAIAAHAAKAAMVTMSLKKQGGGVKVTASALADLPHGAWVQLVRVLPTAQVEIKRGENRGRTLDYSSVVTELDRVAVWDGNADLSLTVDTHGSEAVAVIIQEPGPGRVLAAAMLR